MKIIVKQIYNINSELFNIRFSHATRSLANPMALHNVKKDIARVKTVLREKELEANALLLVNRYGR